MCYLIGPLGLPCVYTSVVTMEIHELNGFKYLFGLSVI